LNQTPEAGGESFLELVSDGFLHVDPGRGGADLSRVCVMVNS
jgi:hypothetical protein